MIVDPAKTSIRDNYSTIMRPNNFLRLVRSFSREKKLIQSRFWHWRIMFEYSGTFRSLDHSGPSF